LVIFEETYGKDDKAKVRAFYKKFLKIVESFIQRVDNDNKLEEELNKNSYKVVTELQN